MRKHHGVVRVLGLFALVGLLGAAAQAQAANHTYPASMCVNIYGATSNFTPQGDGTISNGLAGGVSALCPIVRETLGVTAWTSIQVRVKDQHPSSNVSCTAYARNTNGAIFSFRSAVSVGASPAWQTLTLAAAPAAVPGYYHLNCSLPGVSGTAQSALSYYTANGI